MPTTLDDLATLEHENQVRTLNRRQSVGDHQSGPIAQKVVEALLNQGRSSLGFARSARAMVTR